MAVNVLAKLHRSHRGHGMLVVGRRNGYGVDVLAHFVEHLAVVLVFLGGGMRLEALLAALPVNVAERHDVLHPIVVSIPDIGRAFAANANAGDVKLVAGGTKAFAQHMTRHDEKTAEGRGTDCRRRAIL